MGVLFCPTTTTAWHDTKLCLCMCSGLECSNINSVSIKHDHDSYSASVVRIDSDGSAVPYVKISPLGGMGLFTKGKPTPIEYKRNKSLRNEGFLTAEECDELWESQSELASQYLMEVGIDTQWYRDEVEGDGELRRIADMSRYANLGQPLQWDEDEQAMVMERGSKNLYIPIIEPSENPAAFANDRCFGLADPNEDPDKYNCTHSSVLDERTNEPSVDISFLYQ